MMFHANCSTINECPMLEGAHFTGSQRHTAAAVQVTSSYRCPSLDRVMPSLEKLAQDWLCFFLWPRFRSLDYTHSEISTPSETPSLSSHCLGFSFRFWAEESQLEV
ncbi:hypothetical protein CY34DRAFT_808503 [Suillus luteus UH-Slu-Lm8-n1]|uniref:Uncharacterized protein n=1 Tax=Suillus luteus UH-Slu-Lm8-n1 TaxID=930992 RepID=A0A0D0B5W3_9AGAM|nr:hypothetical protein CY34DRAFT_808503 [Suillus luteus UH-Slu-Lm8-n1]